MRCWTIVVCEVVTFRSVDEVIAFASRLPLATLVFVVDTEELFIRTETGFRNILVNRLMQLVK